MVRVLFVCLGNICRSPMAEAVFLHKVKAAGLENEITADSAGTGDWHLGKPPHRGTQQILEANAIAFAHRARRIRSADFGDFDYILTMDENNLADVNALRQQAALPNTGAVKIARLMDYAPHTAAREVPDPYHTGRYAEVYALIEEAAAGLLAAIRAEHGL